MPSDLNRVLRAPRRPGPLPLPGQQVLALLCILILTNPPALSQLPQRFPVGRSQVLSILQARGWPIGESQIVLPSVTSAVANPELEIQSLSLPAPHEARVRLRCRLHSECAPFFVSLVWPLNVARPPLPVSLDEGGTGAIKASGSSTSGFTGAGAPVAHPEPKPSVRAGSTATLLLEAGRIHIRLQVVCLQAGKPGDQILVATRNRKQTYKAEIVTPTLLKGQL